MQTARLKGKIIEAGYTQRLLAATMNMSTNSLNKKINGQTPFNTDEVCSLCDILGISDNAEKAFIFLT